MMNKMKLVLPLFLIVFLCSFAATQWSDFESKEGNFKASFPMKPEESTQEVNTEIGTLNMNLFIAETEKIKGENSMYIVMYSDYPDSLVSSDLEKSTVDRFLRGAVSGAATNMKGNVTKEEDVVYKKFPGKHVLIDFADGQATMEMEMFLVKNRMYILESGYEKGKANRASITKFFASFQLLAVK